LVVILIFIYIFLLIRRFTKNGDYGYLPYPNEIKDYINHLENAKLGNEEENKQFNEFLYDTYSNIALKNTKTNEIRQSILIKIRNILIINIIILIIMFIPYFILSGNKLNSYKVILMRNNKTLKNNQHNDKKISLIIENININCRINKKKEKKSMKNTENKDNTANQTNQNQQTVQQKNPPVIEKPTMRIVTESYDPTQDIKKVKK
jgi:hypothetical protein